MKKSKYQQYFHCFIVCILGPYAFWFSFQQNIVTILISAVLGSGAFIRGETLIRGRCLFQCGYPNMRRLLERGTYFGLGACQRKYGNFWDLLFCSHFIKLDKKFLADAFLKICELKLFKQIKKRKIYFGLYESSCISTEDKTLQILVYEKQIQSII